MDNSAGERIAKYVEWGNTMILGEHSGAPLVAGDSSQWNLPLNLLSENVLASPQRNHHRLQAGPASR